MPRHAAELVRPRARIIDGPPESLTAFGLPQAMEPSQAVLDRVALPRKDFNLPFLPTGEAAEPRGVILDLRPQRLGQGYIQWTRSVAVNPGHDVVRP